MGSGGEAASMRMETPAGKFCCRFKNILPGW